jgi:hypothetical protein
VPLGGKSAELDPNPNYYYYSYVVVSKLDKEECSFVQNSTAFKSIYLGSK